MGIFDIFGDVVKLTESDNVAKLNDVDISEVTKEELDEAMDFLDRLKDNDFVTLLIGDEYIDNFNNLCCDNLHSVTCFLFRFL